MFIYGCRLVYVYVCVIMCVRACVCVNTYSHTPFLQARASSAEVRLNPNVAV